MKTKMENPGDLEKAANDVNTKLQRLSAEIAIMEWMRSEYKAQMDKLAGQFKPAIEAQTILLDALVLELKRAAKYYRVLAGIPPGTRIDMEYGSVIFELQLKVRRVKDMIARLEAAGRVDLIRVAKSPDWDAVDALSDDDLIALDLEKVEKEIFAYETRKP